MGWLFAVGLGLRHEDRRFVWRALGLMALPCVPGGGAAAAHAAHGSVDTSAAASHAGHALAAGLPSGAAAGVIAALVHTAGYLLVSRV